ncbi:hypothetical protein COZ39_02420, partial [Candidatus Roizmanbacteria bacterium CG_4_10_14_3_um_filter_33_21]
MTKQQINNLLPRTHKIRAMLSGLINYLRKEIG